MVVMKHLVMKLQKQRDLMLMNNFCADAVFTLWLVLMQYFTDTDEKLSLLLSYP